MIKRFAPNQVTVLKEYVAIPYGGIKMLLGTMLVIGLIVGVWLIGFEIHMSLEHTAHSMIAAYANAVCMGLVMLGILRYSLFSAHGMWISGYFARNVRGYTARFWASADMGSLVNDCCVFPNFKFAQMMPSDKIQIDLSLGGWFSRSSILDRMDQSRFNNCSIHLRSINVNIGVIVVELRYNTDRRQHESLNTLTLAQAASVLGVMGMEGQCINSLSQAMVHLMNRNREMPVRVEHRDDKHTQVFEQATLMQIRENASQA